MATSPISSSSPSLFLLFTISLSLLTFKARFQLITTPAASKTCTHRQNGKKGSQNPESLASGSSNAVHGRDTWRVGATGEGKPPWKQPAFGLLLVRSWHDANPHVVGKLIRPLVSGTSPKKWPKMDIVNCCFNGPFLSPRSLLGLEIGTYQLISPIASIWYIYIYITYVWFRL